MQNYNIFCKQFGRKSYSEGENPYCCFIRCARVLRFEGLQFTGDKLRQLLGPGNGVVVNGQIELAQRGIAVVQRRNVGGQGQTGKLLEIT